MLHHSSTEILIFHRFCFTTVEKKTIKKLKVHYKGDLLQNTSMYFSKVSLI